MMVELLIVKFFACCIIALRHVSSLISIVISFSELVRTGTYYSVRNHILQSLN